MKILQLGSGAMGSLLTKELQKDHEVFIFDKSEDIPDENFDVLIDFSNPANLAMMLKFLEKHPLPLIIATTGFDEDQVQQIHQLSTKMPVLFSGNFSVGVNLMQRLIKEMNQVLSDFDIEIIEKHHHFKLDAPSGTTNMLLDTLKEDRDLKPVYGRQGKSPHQADEVGIHSLRSGTIAGEHEVIFAGEDEILSIKHEALSKMIFVKGAVKGMNWLLDKPAGLYSMQDVLFRKV